MHPTIAHDGVDYESKIAAFGTALDRRLKGNLLINGAMQVWQRGTSFASAAAQYGVDRWCFTRTTAAAGATLSRQAGASGQYAARVQRDNGNAGTQTLQFAQSLETPDCIPLVALPVTLTFKARCGANFSSAGSVLQSLVASGTGADQNILTTGYTGQSNFINQSPAISTTQATYTYTGTVPAGATELCVFFGFTPTGTAGAADWFEVEEVQLVVGDYAGNFPYRTFAEELALCQRYYEKSYDVATNPGTNTQNGAHTFVARGADQADFECVAYKVTKRAAATPTVYSTTGASGNIRNLSATTDLAAGSAGLDGMGGFAARPTANATNGHVYAFHWTATAEL